MLPFLRFWQKSFASLILFLAFFGVLQNSHADDTAEVEQIPQPRQRLLDAGVEEIVFAVRQNGVDGHWYANFGYYSTDENRKTYRDGGQLVRLNLKTGEKKLLVDDPKGGVVAIRWSTTTQRKSSSLIALVEVSIIIFTRSRLTVPVSSS